MSSGGVSRRFPRDEEFTEAFVRQPQYGRGSTRFILLRLERSFEHKEPVDLTALTIEHILPQTLTPPWRDMLGARAEHIHSTLLNTLGNLTLTGYNPELSNLPFDEKKAKLTDTHVELNRWLLQQLTWTDSEVLTRAQALLDRAKAIWPGPETPLKV